MRKKCTDQVSIFDLFSNHDIGRELKAMSERLDGHREMLDWVARDLHLKDVYDTGRQGLPAESVLRCALLKQYRQLSYQELAFHVSDSASFQAFARLPGHLFPKKSALQNTSRVPYFHHDVIRNTSSLSGSCLSTMNFAKILC